jgi:hypothetical protein
MAGQLLVGHVLLILEVSRSHSDAPHSVGLLCMRDQPDAESSPSQHSTLTRQRHQCQGGTRTRNPNKREAKVPRLRPCGQWDR